MVCAQKKKKGRRKRADDAAKLVADFLSTNVGRVMQCRLLTRTTMVQIASCEKIQTFKIHWQTCFSIPVIQ